MRKVVSFSGGRTSAYLCKVMIETYGIHDVDFIFMDTGAEHPETYKFIKRVADFFGINLICLQGDFDQPLGVGHGYKVVDITALKYDLGVYSALVKKYGTPSVVSGWCTSRMKEEVHDKYCNDVYGKGGYETWIGIRIDEPKRLKIGKRHDIRYLAEISDFEKADVLAFWRSQPFDLGIDEWLGNCVFCFKKSNLKLAAACKNEPALMGEWLDMIECATERRKVEGVTRHIMYRGKKTLEQVVAPYANIPVENIIARMRGGKMMDTGSCSESCEAFSDI